MSHNLLFSQKSLHILFETRSMGFVAPSSSDFQFIIVMFIRLNIVRRGEERRGKGYVILFLAFGGFLVLSMLDQVMWKRGTHFFKEEENVVPADVFHL